MKDRLEGIDPGPVRFGGTGWRTVRSSWALMSNENPLIDPESCEMTVRDSFAFQAKCGRVLVLRPQGCMPAVRRPLTAQRMRARVP